MTIFTLSPAPPHICIIDFAANLVQQSIERGYRDASISAFGEKPRFERQLGQPHLRTRHALSRYSRASFRGDQVEIRHSDSAPTLLSFVCFVLFVVNTITALRVYAKRLKEHEAHEEFGLNLLWQV